MPSLSTDLEHCVVSICTQDPEQLQSKSRVKSEAIDNNLVNVPLVNSLDTQRERPRAVTGQISTSVSPFTT